MEFPRCPVCHTIVDHLITEFHGDAEHAVVSKLQQRHKEWEPETGLCARCFTLNEYETVAEHFKDITRGSLYRVRLGNEFALLPTPLRMDADPRFAGRGVTIAFIDAGFTPHPDLTKPAQRIAALVDCTDERKPRSYFNAPHPESWHGTMTSVTAAGSGHLSNGLYRGIASEAGVVLIKVMDTRSKRISTADIHRGMQWAIANRKRFNIRVISISVGGDPPDISSPQPLIESVAEAVELGIVVIAAGGNNPEQVLVPPASAPDAITVGGIDDHNQLGRELRSLYHSSFGRTEDGGLKPEIVAPAMWIAGPILPKSEQYREAHALFRILNATARSAPGLIRKYARDIPTPAAPGEYQSWARALIREREYVHPCFKNMDGTSLAAPIVSSIVAQMIEANPALSPRRIREILLETAMPLTNEPDERQGHGMPTARAAVQRALDDIRFSSGIHTPSTGAVCFRIMHPSAHSVGVAGDFNGWDSSRTLLYERAPGEWIRLVRLPVPGTYAYKFVIDGKEWMGDPSNVNRRDDGYGGTNSIVCTGNDHH